MSLLDRPESEREQLAQVLLDRLTPAMSALGVLFVLVVLGEQLARGDSALSQALTVTGWLLWVVFALELAARAVVAPDSGRFWRRNWWQLAFLVLPFLRVFRLVRAARFLRGGRMLSGAVRGTRSTAALLRSRLGWLGSMWLITVLLVSELLYSFAGFRRFGDALHAAALAAITGEPLGRTGAFAEVVEVLLAAFSVVVFGSLAGALGAYFLGADRHSGSAVAGD